MKENTIFDLYFKNEKLIDRNISLNSEESVDVIMPLMATNDLFEKNLLSIYKEIPVNRLIIGNAGCVDDSLEIAKNFPRVEIIDQTSTKSLGYCLAQLISLVKTDWFVYLHTDVFLPHDWYNNMQTHKNAYDWFECDRRMTYMLDFGIPELNKVRRALSGSQMGRTEAFKNIIKGIDDDFLYRNEDLFFQELILEGGFKYGRIFDTFHYHQIMKKRGEKEPDFKAIEIIRERNFELEKRTITMQVKGIIKYLQPKSYLLKEVNDPLNALKKLKAIDMGEFIEWVKKTNPKWLPYLDLKEINPPPTIFQRLYYVIMERLNPIIQKFIKK